MNDHLSKVLIETIVRSTLKDIQEAPERQTRKLVDMALHFAPGQAQSRFFEVAQDMLESEDSAYYALIRDVVSQVDEERLVQFGMNVGYNSCVTGVKTIRAAERRDGYTIPWTLLLEIDTNDARYIGNRYQSLLHQGKQLGIFTWLLFCRSKPDKLLPLITSNPECAFVLFCRPCDITEELIEQSRDLPHLAFAVRTEAGVDEACHLLRRNHCIYAVFDCYGEHNADSILDDSWISETQPLHAAFSFLIPMPGCPEIVQEKVYQYTLRIREEQKIPTILMETTGDLRTINTIVSNDGACIAGFDSDGHVLPHLGNQDFGCIFQDNLKEILRKTSMRSAALAEKLLKHSV